MISRIYAILFLICIIAGAFYQRNYMRTSTAEVRALEERLSRDSDLLRATDFVLDRHVNGRRTDRISAGSGRVTTDGSLQLETNIWITHFDTDAAHSKIHTSLATGKLRLPSRQSPAATDAPTASAAPSASTEAPKGGDAADSTSTASAVASTSPSPAPSPSPRSSPAPSPATPAADLTSGAEGPNPEESSGEDVAPTNTAAMTTPEPEESPAPRTMGGSIESLRFPEEVTAYLPEGVIRTSNVYLDFSTHILTTDEVVTYRGQGKSLRGKGMSFKLEEGNFELRGPVTGELEPALKRSKGGR